MELFKNTNFDFLGKKWPFIGLSLVLTAAGLISIGVKGMRYGIDFKGGAQMSLRFAQEPPVQQIRSALESKLPGEISVQQVSGKPEVLIGTEIKDEKELNANRQLIDETLRGMFGGSGGKFDLNNSLPRNWPTGCAGRCSRLEFRSPSRSCRICAPRSTTYRADHGGILRPSTSFPA